MRITDHLLEKRIVQ